MTLHETCSSCGRVLLWHDGRLICVNATCTTGHEPIATSKKAA